MFDVALFSFSKPQNSTKKPAGGETFLCQMVESCGILTPRVTFNQGTDWNPSAYNYAYIETFGRYYWITEWTWGNGMWAASMKVDPLASWKSDILSLSEYVLRASSTFDGSVIDTFYPASTTTTKQSESFPFWEAYNFENGAYVIGVLGNNQTAVGGVAYYVCSSSDLGSFMEKVMGSTEWIGSVDEISDELLKCLVNPMQYITSVMWLPIPPWNPGSSSRVFLGWWDSMYGLPELSTYAQAISGTFVSSRPSHPQAGRGSYLNYSPYTEIFVEITPFGKISLDPYKYPAGSPVKYLILVDPISGMGVLHLYTKQIGDGDMFQAKVGVQLSVGQATSSVNGAVGSAVSAVEKATTPVMYGAAGAAHAGRTSRLTGIGDAISALNPELNVIGQNGGAALYAQPAVYTCLFHHVVGDDNEREGRPLCQKKTLSSLSGYTLVSDPDVDIPAMQAEKDEIAAMMTGGFYIE